MNWTFFGWTVDTYLQTTFTFRHKYLSFLSLSSNFQGSTTPTELFPMGVCLSINWDCFSHDKYTPGTLSYNSIWIRTVWSCSDFGDYKHETTEKSLLTCEEMLGHQGRLNVKCLNWISILQIEEKNCDQIWDNVVGLKNDKLNRVPTWPQYNWKHFLTSSTKCSLYTFDMKEIIEKTLSEKPPKHIVYYYR